MRLDAAPQCPFGGDADWVRGDPHYADAKLIEMRLPGSLIGEPRLLMGGQRTDDRPGKVSSAHIVQRRRVDDAVCEPGAQEIQEVQPALARAGAEPGEIIVADLGGEAVLASMACTSVIHRDPGRRPQARPQYVTVLIKEPILSSDQQAHHLPLGDGDANAPQLCHQPWHGHLPLMYCISTK